MKIELQKEHQWLQKLVGEWTYEAECAMELGKPPEKFEAHNRTSTDRLARRMAGRPQGAALQGEGVHPCA
jgi:hypothetical protein